MIRHAAAVAFVASLSPSWLCAQSTEFTVNTASANVHKSPSTGSPVIGKASRGSVLSVTRELGSWVRVSWPAAQDGVGYLHVSTGWIARISAPGSRPAAGPSASTSAPRTGPAPAAGVQAARAAAGEPPPQALTTSLAPTAHRVGLGGRMGDSTLGFGASARAALGSRIGVQLEVSRYALTSLAAQQRLTSIQFAPSVLFTPPDKLTDYIWVRPYVGAGITVYRSTLGGVTPAAADSVTDNRLGRQVFGGTELTFAAVPRFSVSADYGYRWPQSPFDGFELGGRGLAVSGHWYVR